MQKYDELKVAISSSNYISKWVHIVGVYDASNSTQYLYLDGVKVGENSNHNGVVDIDEKSYFKIGK